ncbi:MAG: hypothetical protein HYZ45_01160 [Burkholderiales bacterium]|nr:hypothetical protein [Burkholderiales bacterium]
MADIQSIELNPVEARYIGRLVPVKFFDHQAKLESILQLAKIDYAICERDPVKVEMEDNLARGHNEKKYRYFGRHGGTAKVLAIYRLPAAQLDGMFDFKHFRIMELLQYDGSWISGDTDSAEADWMHGWFDETDELSEEYVLALSQKWRVSGWPGKRSIAPILPRKTVARRTVGFSRFQIFHLLA